MNAPFTLSAQSERNAIRRAHIKRLADALNTWADNIGRRDEDYHALVATDRAQFVFEADFSDELANLRHDLWIDEEGYPLDAEGETVPGAERSFIPAVRGDAQ